MKFYSLVKKAKGRRKWNFQTYVKKKKTKKLMVTQVSKFVEIKKKALNAVCYLWQLVWKNVAVSSKKEKDCKWSRGWSQTPTLILHMLLYRAFQLNFSNALLPPRFQWYSADNSSSWRIESVRKGDAIFLASDS